MLLAVSMDDEEYRPRIPAFLAKHGFHGRVLLGDKERLKGYDTQTTGILYAVDRKGMLAGIPREFEPDMETQAERRVARLLSSDSASGPLLFSVQEAPEGFGILWKQPLPAGAALMALAPNSKGRAAEVGLLDKAELRRFSRTGEPLGVANVNLQMPSFRRNARTGGLQSTGMSAQDPTFLEGSDLDGDGKIEWILGWGNQIALVDSEGQKYWSSYSPDEIRSVWTQDLDGDGAREIVLQQGASLAARRAVLGSVWITPPLLDLKSVVPNPGGGFLVHEGNRIQTLDQRGKLSDAGAKAPVESVLAGRIGGGKSSQDLFTLPDGPEVRLLNDFTKKGETEILVASPGFLSIYAQDGKPRLSLKLSDSGSQPILVAGDLDGLPGDEIVLFLQGYGIVALGVAPSVKAGVQDTSQEIAVNPGAHN